MMVKVGIIGAGFMGETHAAAYKEIQDAEIVAIVDKVEEKGEKLTKKFGGKYYSNIDEMLEKEDVDCIDICLPTFLHLEMLKKGAEAKKHILCEKPLTLSLEDADKMIEIVEKNKVKAMVGHVLRFWPEYVSARELALSGRLGEPLYAFCERLTVPPQWYEDKWGLNEKNSGGVPLDLSIHDLDYLIWLFEKPSIVKAEGLENKDLGGIIHIATTIEFENGKKGLAEGGWAVGGEFPFTMVLRIICEKGTIDWVFRAGKNIEERAQKSQVFVYEHNGNTYTLDVGEEDPYYLECKYFIDCILHDKPIENATLEDGKKALSLGLAATKSVREKSVVRM